MQSVMQFSCPVKVAVTVPIVVFISSSHEGPICHFTMIWCHFPKNERGHTEMRAPQKVPSVGCGSALHNSSALQGFQDVSAEISAGKWAGMEVAHCCLCLWHHQEFCQLPRANSLLQWWCKRQKGQLDFQILGKMGDLSSFSKFSFDLKTEHIGYESHWKRINKKPHEVIFTESFLEYSHPSSNKTWHTM